MWPLSATPVSALERLLELVGREMPVLAIERIFSVRN